MLYCLAPFFACIVAAQFIAASLLAWRRSSKVNKLLLEKVWDKALTGMVLLRRVGNDLQVIRENPESRRVNAGQLSEGGLLGVKMPAHHATMEPYGASLIQIYLDCLKSGETKRLEVKYPDKPVGWFKINVIPISRDILLISFIDISALKQEACTDVLTGLYHRRYLDHYPVSQGACIFLDLDRFKAVNDLRGHHLGDQILRAVADILRGLTDAHGGVTIRWGGDEFLMLLPNSGKAEAWLIAVFALEQILALSIDGASVGVSIGIAESCGQSRCDMEQSAEIAAMQAKKDRSSTAAEKRIRVWDAEMAASYNRGVRIEAYLHKSEVQSEFSLVYQPIYDLFSLRMVGCEALIRWNCAQLGRVPPDEFIPIAEQSGQIAIVSDWVIGEAFEQTAKWCKLDPQFALSINISPIELEGYWLAGRLKEQMLLSGLKSENLEIEVTERGVMGNVERYVQALSDLQSSKIRIKLDDFGVGQSGLLHLLRVQFHEVKVDKALLPTSMEDARRVSVCRAIASIAAVMGFGLVAEGIETETQLKLMQSLGYSLGQGYYLSRPVTAEEITKILEAAK